MTNAGFLMCSFLVESQTPRLPLNYNYLARHMVHLSGVSDLSKEEQRAWYVLLCERCHRQTKQAEWCLEERVEQWQHAVLPPAEVPGCYPMVFGFFVVKFFSSSSCLLCQLWGKKLTAHVDVRNQLGLNRPHFFHSSCHSEHKVAQTQLVLSTSDVTQVI